MRHLVWVGVVGVAFAAAVVAGAVPPANTSPPSINDTTPVVGQTLTGSEGIWTVDPEPETAARTYEWCTPACAEVLGSGLQYQVQAADAGKALVFRVTVTNIDGATPVDSTQTSAVVAPPVNTSPPTIDDTTPTVGQVLNASPGTWTGGPAFAYQWCSPACVGGSAQYTVQPGDVGKQFFVRVTGTNTAGSVPADSATTAAVPPVAPVNTSLPTIDDTTPTVGAVLTASPGSWTGAPAPSFTYQWCSPGCVGGGSQYTVQPGDVGKQFFVRVTGTNGGGSDSADSATTAAVPPVAPVNTSLPTIDDTTPTIGTVLTASPGSWTGTPAPSFTYQWCTPGCATVLGSGTQYTVLAADVGRTLIARVTATNSGGVVSADSAATAAVPGIAPVNTAIPTLNLPSPTFVPGTPPTLNATSPGTWTATPAVILPYAYEWQRCTSTAPGTCAGFGAANQASYTLLQTDVGFAFRVKVTATNGVVPDGVAFSTVTALVAQTPFNNGTGGTVLPTITVPGDGIPDRGDTITGLSGTWFAWPVPALGHQWRRCNLAGTLCSNIGAPITNPVTTTLGYQHTSSSTYVVTEADLGSRIRLRVIAGTGTTPFADSALTEAVRGAPVNVAGQPPAVTGTPVRGQTLSTTSGLWTGYWPPGPPVAFTHQWQRCLEDGTGCVAVATPAEVAATLVPRGAPTCTSAVPCSGATTYLLSDADMGSRIRVVVKATNGSGTTVEVTTALTAVVQGAPQILQANGQPDPNAIPKINGLAQSGLNIGASTGSWSAFPDAITYAYQWVRCSGTDVASCSAIGGATTEIYAVQDADAGQRLRIRITASNGIEPAGVAHSDPTEPVKAKSAGVGGDGVDLLLSAKVSSAGGRLTYTLTVTNAGNQGATGVAVNATPPAGISVASATAPGGCSGSSPVTCALGALGPGAKATATIVIQATQTGVVSFSASAGSAETDVNPSNNSVSLTTFLVVTGSTPQAGNGTGGSVGPGGVRTAATNPADQRFVALKDVRLKARRVGGTWVVATKFSLISGRSDLRLVVTRNGSDKELTLQEGSRFGGVVVEGSSEEVAFTAKPATFPVKVVLPAKGFSLKQIYVIRITATAAGGASTSLNIGFKGAKVVARKTTATRAGTNWVASSTFAVPAGKTAVQAWVSLGVSAKKLPFLSGSRLGTARAKASVSVLKLQATKAGTLPVRIVLSDRGFSLTQTYVIRVEAKSANGLWTDYEISFKGKAPARVLTGSRATR